ncbi:MULTISPECIES: DNA polymerase I [Thermomonospora]|uniref:DNA polymerase I n=1 Tax=Thermomonospora curvata (strain ATCC 19995 / DSM 43183 / JCM 3096 / KCTC 9072 / NBRC 15933 / NCIMB 10081 / Henssen B9) TaxID=471852 RepID=D1A6Z3_THECD|nr:MULTISPECIES: DNA polymerase I [Thermomonospora]ACY98397.1 DNA polymerase I [Thermomonospora curvata DSM 43183]PKK13550.1 MAG: DNA polymerase I [Thermomonospora sp. CIF 1]
METTAPTPDNADRGAGEGGRLLLLDGHSLAYRAFFALPVENFSTTDGQPTNAVYGFTSMLINVLRDEQPTHVAVAFDRSEPTFRHEQYADYKAGRAKAPDEFRSQVSLIFEVLDALRIPRLSVPGYEADDIIATLASQASAQGMQTLVVTGDRDAFQLVNEHVTVLYPVRGVSELVRYDPAKVAEKYGVPPERYRELAALVGETSDNLPGVPGVGPKTAAKWLTQYGDLDGLVRNADKLKGKAGAALREHLPQVLRNHQINKLDCAVPLEVGPAQLRLGQWDREEIHTLFDTLQFRVLRERLYATLSAVEPEAEEGFAVELTRLEPGALAAWLAEHAGRAGERVGLAVTGRWGRGTGEVDALAVATASGAAVYVEPAELGEADERALAEWLADPHRPKAIHDAKGPMLALAARGMTLAGVTSDTALAAYLALPGQRTFDLGDLVLRYLHKELREHAEPGGQLTIDGIADDDAARELAVRARAVLELAEALDRDLERRGAARLLHEVELPLTGVLAAMERAGIAVDVDHFIQLSASLGGQAKDTEQQAHAAVGHEFNLGSPKQVQQVLFEELGLPKTKRTKTGYTTDSEALNSLRAKSDHPVLEHILRWREVAKLKSIVDSLIPMAAEDGRIHTTFNQMVAATGRLSSTDPNLQNIPIRTAEGRQIREGFVVGEGYECLLTADYSQIELRIMAHLSGDEALIEAFTSGADFHTITASRVFGLPPEQIDGELRARIKAMNYGLAYGLSPFGLASQLGITPDEARVLMEEYFQQFGGVRDYLQGVVRRARQDGYTETILGRRRYLPDLTSDNRQRREMAERMALNAPIQGSAADIIKVASLRVDRALRERGLASRMLLQVHDELVFEVAPGELEELKELVREQMTGAYELRAPLEVAMGTGRTWQQAGH